MQIKLLMAALATVMLVAACGGSEPGAPAVGDGGNDVPDISVTDAELAGNPFLEVWDTPYGVPPFDRIRDEHFMPAFKKGILDMRAEIALIADSPDEPTFENSILAKC